MTLANPDKSVIAVLSVRRAEFASRDITSRTEVFPVPFAPIITHRGRSENCTLCRRRNPWIESSRKRVGGCVEESMIGRVVLSSDHPTKRTRPICLPPEDPIYATKSVLLKMDVYGC